MRLCDHFVVVLCQLIESRLNSCSVNSSMCEGPRHGHRERISAEDGLDNQDQDEVSHSLLYLVGWKISRSFVSRNVGANIYFSAMFHGPIADWLTGFARRILNRNEQCDWFTAFFVDGRRILESSNLENSTIGFIFEIWISKRCPKLCEVTPGERCVPYRFCWVWRPVQIVLKSSEKGAHKEFTLRSQGEENRRLKARIVSVPDCTNRKLFFSFTREQVKLATMSKGPSSNMNLPSTSKLPTPTDYMKQKTEDQVQMAPVPTKKRTRRNHNPEKVPKENVEEVGGDGPDAEAEASDSKGDGDQVDNHGEEQAEEITENQEITETPKENNESVPTVDEMMRRQSGGNFETNVTTVGGNSWAKIAEMDLDDIAENNIFNEPDVTDDETVLEMFGINDALKNKIAQLLEDGVLPLEVDDDTDVTIDEKDFVDLRNQRKTTSTRFTLIADNENEAFAAEKPSQDIVDELLFLSTGLGLPVEIIAQKPTLINKDFKEKRVAGQIFPTGLKQKWELQVTSWIDLNLSIVCGKKSFQFGTGSDKWKIYTPGAYKDEEKSFYAQGICPDPTITNVQIAKQLIKQGYDILQGARGVKDSPSNGRFEATKSGSKYFFLKTEIAKKSEDEYHKIQIGVWSDNRKKVVPMSFSVREKMDKSKKENNENVTKAKKCIACGNGEEKCSGHLEILCSWKDVNIQDWIKKKKELFEEITPFVKNATVTHDVPVSEAENKVKKYLKVVRDDLDKERKIRIRNFLAHNVKNEVQKSRLGEGKTLDDGGFITATKKKDQKSRILKRTIQKPYPLSDFRIVASYTGSFGNKDRIIATIYRWPTRNYEGSRVKALTGNLSVKQLSELVTKAGAKDNKSMTAVAKVEAIQDEERRKEAYAKWLDDHVQALESSICTEQ